MSLSVAVKTEPELTARKRPRLLVVLARQSKLGTFAGLLLLVMIVVALAAPLVAPANPVAMAPVQRLKPPGAAGLLGTDVFGRDVLSRIIYGTRISLVVGVSSVLAAGAIGTLLGLIAGYLGRWQEYLIMRLLDVLFAFPSVLLAILIVAINGAGFRSIVIAITIVYTPIFGRIVRGSTLSLKNVEYVQAAVAAGASTGRVLWRHILPNIIAPIIVQLALSLSGAIVVEAALSFLGLGAVPPTPSLGSMLSENRNYMERAPWTVIYPGLALGLLVLCINLFGDAIRDVLDPRLRTERG